MDIILLILAKSLEKHGTTLVHITFLSLISVLIFAMFLEIFTHVVGENVFFFLQFIAVKIPCRSTIETRGRGGLTHHLHSEAPAGNRRMAMTLARLRLIVFLRCIGLDRMPLFLFSN